MTSDDLGQKLQTIQSQLGEIQREVGRLAELRSKLESATAFLEDAQPIGNDLFHRFILKLDELEQKGYFRVGADLQATADAFVQTLASRNVLPAIESSLRVVNETDPEQIDRYTVWKMYRATKSPEMQRLMGIFMTFLQALAREMEPPQAKSA
jgi:uncharacterized protein YjgD (DUF1641 family)